MNFTAIAREDLEAKGMLLKNKIEIEANYNAVPDVYMLHIARKNAATDEIESFFTADRENGNTKEFNRLKENVLLSEKKRTIVNMESLEERNVVDYFVPYDVQESSMNRPTITERHVENGIHSGHYECEYELFLTCDDATRRVVIPYSSVNIPMISFLSDIEAAVWELLNGEADADNPFKKIIRVNDGDDWGNVIMFDDIGQPYDIEIDTPSDFTSMIVSVRQVKCEYVKTAETAEC